MRERRRSRSFSLSAGRRSAVLKEREGHMASYYDDNYGFYDVESDDDVAFYFETQRQSVNKKCEGCGRKVRIKPDYAYCNSLRNETGAGRRLLA
jgi:hypothetical protein